MASGPFHYQRAEALLSGDAQVRDGDLTADMLCAVAHGLLALAAATALGSEPDGQLPDDQAAWIRAASEQPAAARRRREAERAEQAEWDSVDSNAYQDRLEAGGGES